MSNEDKEPYETQSNASKAEYARMKLLTPAERIMVLAAQAMHHPVRYICACLHAFRKEKTMPFGVNCVHIQLIVTNQRLQNMPKPGAQLIVTSQRLQDVFVPACMHAYLIVTSQRLHNA